ncbi:hypothetical protein V8F33_012470 [Rhypophila sp. PSN 637]
MESTTEPSSSNNRNQDGWNSLITRSMGAWDPLGRTEGNLEKSSLESWSNLDDFLLETSRPGPMFWFFQTREAFLTQKTMTKWSRDNLDSYILLPATNSGYQWLYIWIDWTCAPQEPRTETEPLIRNAGFVWHYPPFEARLWILFEVAEFHLTSDPDYDPLEAFEHMEEFAAHVKEMVKFGVQRTLEKYKYRCSYPRDKEFITSWLELLVLLVNLEFDIYLLRQFMDILTWFTGTQKMVWVTTRGIVELQKFEGTLTINGHQHTFTPFPQWNDGKYSGKT